VLEFEGGGLRSDKRGYNQQGLRHEHVSTEILEDIVECALIPRGKVADGSGSGLPQ
jgi:hypothetical protein